MLWQILFWIAVVAIVIHQWLIHILVKRVQALTDEGMRLEIAANENDLALRQGLDDQLEIHQAEMHEYADKYERTLQDLKSDYETRIQLLEDRLARDAKRLSDTVDERDKAYKAFAIAKNEIRDLNELKAFHVNNCLPVLEHLRKENSSGDGDGS